MSALSDEEGCSNANMSRGEQGVLERYGPKRDAVLQVMPVRKTFRTWGRGLWLRVNE